MLKQQQNPGCKGGGGEGEGVLSTGKRTHARTHSPTERIKADADCCVYLKIEVNESLLQHGSEEFQ